MAELQSRIGAPGTSTPSRGQQAKAPSTITTAGPPTPESSATQHKTDDEGQPAPETAGPIQPVGRPPEPPKESRPPEVAAIFDQPGVLTPKGSLILEPSLLSSHSSNKRISLHGYTIIPAITIGLIDVLAISRDTYVAALSTRYGLTNRLELELKIPYVYGTEESSTKPFAGTTNIEDSYVDGYGLGDIEFGLRYQLNQPQDGPYYIAGLRVKSDTGTGPFDISRDPDTQLPNELTTGSGFWGFQGSLSAILLSDPAVFFGSINYLWNVARDVGTVNGDDFGRLDPGDAYGFNFGMGLSLNEKASFSLGYDHSILSRNKQNGEIIPDQVTLHVGSLQLGYSYRLTDKSNLNLSLSIGVTENAPDVQLTLKMPMTL
ncbi:MAG: transporter [Desulfuromonadaceae bacterium]|nr:transporter [Desulfuromonadaceae bacterium]